MENIQDVEIPDRCFLFLDNKLTLHRYFMLPDDSPILPDDEQLEPGEPDFDEPDDVPDFTLLDGEPDDVPDFNEPDDVPDFTLSDDDVPDFNEPDDVPDFNEPDDVPDFTLLDDDVPDFNEPYDVPDFTLPDDVSADVQKLVADRFRAVTDVESLAHALTSAARVETPETSITKPVQVRTLTWYLYHKTDRYRTFTIPKKTPGEVREIKAPDHALLRIQRLLLVCLSSVFTPDKAAHGFTADRSILTNAQPHVGRRYVYNLDLRDFFPSTHFGRVTAVLQLPPFSLPKAGAWLVANLCTDRATPKEDGQPGRAYLPQGAPTSPLLTNAVCQRLDRKLRQLARKHRTYYTRYADDLTFSANHAAFTDAFRQALLGILQAEGYESNEKKERLLRPWQRQEVTGVVVNERPGAPREYVRQIRAMLHNWEKHGYEAASANLRQHYHQDKGHARHQGTVPKLERVLAGKIAYLEMLEGAENSPTTFRDKLNRLVAKEEFRAAVKEAFKR